MSLYEKLLAKEEKIAVIGLGYVGLPVAVEFAKKYDVIGFDINEEKLDKYRSGIDVTDEVGDEAIQQTTMTFTSDEKDLQKCKFHIVSVPTPINLDKTPNLAPIINASKSIARNLTKGSIVVYESTVYPGTTEEICIPILEEVSGLTFGEDFKVGYSPERINPGDKVNTLTKIIKVVSGSDEEALREVSSIYGAIIEAGVHEAESIKVAEASKVIENSQRDINIAFMNELAMVFNKMDIDTNAVLEAASTKWNFLKFTPGLVGGHCIGVDPYYFTYKAEQLGYHSQIILAGRKVNDDMGKYVAKNVIKQMIQAKQELTNAKIGVLGLTFKENVADVRNTKVTDIITELEDYGLDVLVHDPIAEADTVYREYGIELVDEAQLKNLDCLVLAVPHDVFKEKYTLDVVDTLYKNDKKVLVDIRGIFDRQQAEEIGIQYWNL
ncbi:nucleotide sugar dehydrogenase [Cerasibacillus terrae]|uniref:Nucleotide sugar dehydrogenase n=1 Tax=Cerasibacillus terrae TaxID=2498845 RepID=A0A5C8NZE1_9BACI|nr:nucleotide sugar dehydrogenase [Cerasibacillus terrae]TXL66669.1 nucleotide sugar dehydrogenase [Cerasibacillus terrae]